MSPRNHLIDLSRALSVVVVVTFHCLLYQIVVVDGRPQVVPIRSLQESIRSA